MLNFDLLRFNPNYLYPFSKIMINYVNNLELHNRFIRVFFPWEIDDPYDNAELFINKGTPEIRIRDTEILESFELRLAHELTHLSLLDRGYSHINTLMSPTANVGERNQAFFRGIEGRLLANLLHHMILCPQLVENHFINEPVPAFDFIKEDISFYRQDYSSLFHEGKTYIILDIMNNIVLSNNTLPEPYISMIGELPGALEQAQNLLTFLATRYNNFLDVSIDQYHLIKEDIRRELQIQSEYPFCNK